MVFETIETKDYCFEISPQCLTNFSCILESKEGHHNTDFRRYYSLQFLMAIQYLYTCGLSTNKTNINGLKLYCNYNG